MLRVFNIERNEFQRNAHGLSFMIGTCRRCLLSFYRCFDECAEKRVRCEGARFHFGMELRTEEKRVDALRKFRYFHEVTVG